LKKGYPDGKTGGPDILLPPKTELLSFLKELSDTYETGTDAAITATHTDFVCPDIVFPCIGECTG
jgi:hypothetical protein